MDKLNMIEAIEYEMLACQCGCLTC